MQVFQRLLGTENVTLQGLTAYNTDFFGEISGNAKVVLRPKTCAEVSALMKYCSAEGISVVPQGGNTGLCGANIAQKGEVLVSMGRMTEVLEIDEDVPAVHVSAGHTLEAVIERARSKGFLFPLDLGAKGSCQIGGNLATNAGGLRFLRYGSLHANTLALEVVLSSGEVLSDFCHMRKNNTAYDLKQLFIGSEGTLGLITKATISLYPFPRSIQVAIFGCAGFSEVLGMYSLAKQRLHEVLSAFEYFDRRSLGLVLQHIPSTRDPFSAAFPYYVLVETHGSDDAHDFEKLSSLLEATGGMQVEGVLAKDERERLELWRLRETCAVAYAKSGPTHVYDFSLPIARFEDTVRKAEKIVGSDGVVVGLGHLGDSNLHIGVIHPPGKSLSRDTESRIYQTVMDCNGSISAEHGIGTIKKGELWRSKSKHCMEMMVKCR